MLTSCQPFPPIPNTERPNSYTISTFRLFENNFTHPTCRRILARVYDEAIKIIEQVDFISNGIR